MLSGVLSSDSLTQVFRTLSQKRRHGILEIAAATGQVEVSFQNGKIVGAYIAEQPMCDVICDRLFTARLISQDTCTELQTRALLITELYEQLVGTENVQHDDFMRAKRAAELDVLYSLRKLNSGYYQFKSKIVPVEPELSISVSPGQLLLDMMELDASEERFVGEFGDILSTSTSIERLKEQCDEASAEELLVWQSIDAANCLKEIHDLTLLSEFELREAMLALYDKRLIRVSEADGTLSSSVPVEGRRRGEGIRNPLDDEDSYQDPDAEGISYLTNADEGEDNSSDMNVIIDDAAGLLSQVDDNVKIPEVSTVSSLFDREDGNLLSEEQAAGEESGVAEDGDVEYVQEGNRMSIKGLIVRADFFLTQEKVLNIETTVLTLAFFGAIAYFVPEMIENWFETLKGLISTTSKLK